MYSIELEMCSRYQGCENAKCVVISVHKSKVLYRVSVSESIVCGMGGGSVQRYFTPYLGSHWYS